MISKNNYYWKHKYKNTYKILRMIEHVWSKQPGKNEDNELKI